VKKLIYSLILTELFAVALVAGPQGQEQPAQPPSGPAAKVRQDLATAVRNATLSDDQKRALEDAGSRLRAAREARQSGDKVDRKSLKKALDEIRQVSESGAFKPEDQAAVKADLDALQANHEGRPRLFRRR
jgi:pantothenate synthetase